MGDGKESSAHGIPLRRSSYTYRCMYINIRYERVIKTWREATQLNLPFSPFLSIFFSLSFSFISPLFHRFSSSLFFLSIYIQLIRARPTPRRFISMSLPFSTRTSHNNRKIYRGRKKRHRAKNKKTEKNHVYIKLL